MSRCVSKDADYLYDKFVLLGEKTNKCLSKKKKTFRRKQETFVVSEIPLWKSGSRNNSSDTFVNFSMEDGEIVVQNITFQKSMFVGRVMKECRRNEKVSRKFGSFKGS